MGEQWNIIDICVMKMNGLKLAYVRIIMYVKKKMEDEEEEEEADNGW